MNNNSLINLYKINNKKKERVILYLILIEISATKKMNLTG